MTTRSKARTVKLESARPKARYTWRAGAAFAEEHAALAGAALARMAREASAEGIRSLDPKEVFEKVYADPDHPMRPLYGDFADERGAARRHWIDLTRRIISSIRIDIVHLKMKPIGRVEPMFVYAPSVPVQDGGRVRSKRRHVMLADALQSDPVYASAVGFQIRAILNAIGKLDGITSNRRPIAPRDRQLVLTLQRTIENYQVTSARQAPLARAAGGSRR